MTEIVLPEARVYDRNAFVTANQRAFLNTLLKVREVPEVLNLVVADFLASDHFTAKSASVFIRRLHELPLKEGAVTPSANTQIVGHHKFEGRIFEVKVAKNSGRLYANEITSTDEGEVEYSYIPEIIPFLSVNTLCV